MKMTEGKPIQPLDLEQVYALLTQALALLMAIRGRADLLSDEAAFACGEAAGLVSNARVLVRRDMGNATRNGWTDGDWGAKND
jgi:hypothetical protein